MQFQLDKEGVISKDGRKKKKKIKSKKQNKVNTVRRSTNY